MIDESQVVEGANVYVRTIGERVRVTEYIYISQGERRDA